MSRVVSRWSGSAGTGVPGEDHPGAGLPPRGVLLADVRSVGVTDGERTYGYPIVLRPIMTTDAMTADWVRVPFDVLSDISNRITAEVPQINRVVLDITPKPPATIEWE